MKIFNNTNHLTGTVLATLACVAFVGCTKSYDRGGTTSDTTTRMNTTTSAPVVDTSTQSTASNTTVAADDTPKTMDNTGEVPPAAADAGAPAAENSATSTTTTEKKTTKHMKHKAKKAHRKAAKDAAIVTHPEPSVANEDRYDRSYDYSHDHDAYDRDARDRDAHDRDAYDHDAAVSDRYDNTVSGTTVAPDVYRETGLSPFAQEPNSRIPAQIGSGQLTGEDKSTTVLEGPNLFQDPSALGRDLIK